MNSIYTSTAKQVTKGSLTVLAIILCLALGVLLLQSRKFVSSLGVLLEFGYDAWDMYLLSMLQSLVIWALVTGIIFSIQFLIYTPDNNPKKIFSRMALGFIIGFIFTYLLVLIIGVIIYIPLGTISLFMPEIIKYATLAFAWLVAAYIVFIFIAIDAPRLLHYVIKEGNSFFKLLGLLMAMLLGVQVLKAIVGGLSIVMENSTWRTNAALLAIGLSLLSTISINLVLLRRQALPKIIFTIAIVYIASIVTGNLSYSVFHWGELLSFLLAAFIGPIAYSLVARKITSFGITAIPGILGFMGGSITGLLIAQYGNVRIIGQGLGGILCGTMIAIGFGLAFGLLWGPAIGSLLIAKAGISPVVGYRIGVGVWLGIIVGVVSGGFMAR
jgi:hypothetical protein